MLEYNCQVIEFFRCNNDTKVLEFVYGEQNTPALYDIYAISKQSSCGLRSGAFTGTGDIIDPFVLSIDLSAGLAAQDPDCGVTQGKDSVIHLEMVIQQQCGGLTGSDIRYHSDCSMTIPVSSGKTETATYTCVSPSSIVFNFRQTDPNLDSPSDIYVIERRSSCSKSSGFGTGTGSANDPFSMRIDVGTMAIQCGVQLESQDVYSVQVYVQMFPSILTSDDILYHVTCDFASSSSIGIETQVKPAEHNPPVTDADQFQPRASLSVVTTSGTALTTLTVGNPIRLVAQLLDGPASGLRVISCQASPGPGQLPILTFLNNKGCSTTLSLVPPFIGQAPTGSVAMTNGFKAFKFDQSDTVYFSCQAELCYDSNLRCLGSHCDGNKRRKRQAGPRNATLGQELGVLVIVTDPTSGNSSDKFDMKTSGSIHQTTQWPVAALVTTSSLATACLALTLLTIFLLTRHRKHDKGQGPAPAAGTVQAVNKA